MVIDLDSYQRKKAVEAALQKDPKPAIKRQQALLSTWAGKGVVLDAWVPHPVDPVQGVLDTLREIGVTNPTDGNKMSQVVTASGAPFSQAGEGGEPYRVRYSLREILLRQDHSHLENLKIDIVPFLYDGEEYMRVFRQYRKDEKSEPTNLATFLYQKDSEKCGIWVEKHPKDVHSSDRRWLLEEIEPEEFLHTAAEHYIRRKNITLERFVFSVDPLGKEPGPKESQSRQFFSALRRKIA